MSRYIERAENVARFVDVNLNLSLDSNDMDHEQWLPLVATTGDHTDFTERYGMATRENVIHFLAFDVENPNSIVSCLRFGRENARSVRESITSAMWEHMNSFYLMVNKMASQGIQKELSPNFFTDVRLASQLFVGITDSTMSHGEGWHFSRMGRMLERADKTSRILDVKYYILLPQISDVGSPIDDIQWSAVLRSASAFEMYRQRFGRIEPESIVDFLVLDREFPRAVNFCMMRAEESLHAITGCPAGTFRNPAEQKLGQLRSRLSFLHVSDVIDRGLHEFVDDLQNRLNEVDEAIFNTFFALRPVGAAVDGR
jgi:uncharacterized alpha-E superfamily protein